METDVASGRDKARNSNLTTPSQHFLNSNKEILKMFNSKVAKIKEPMFLRIINKKITHYRKIDSSEFIGLYKEAKVEVPEATLAIVSSAEFARHLSVFADKFKTVREIDVPTMWVRTA